MAEEKYYKSVNNSEKIEMTPEEVAEMKRTREEFAKDQWFRDRRASYPEITEQLDMLWHDIDQGRVGKLGNWYKACKAVKDAIPKPQERANG